MLLSGTQQPPRPNGEDMGMREWRKQVREDEMKIERIVKDIAMALTGRKITIHRKKP